MRLKAMAECFKGFADFQMVIDLAVEDDRGVAIGRINRLIAPAQIDDLEARCAKAAGVGLVDALLIGPTMKQGRSGPANTLRFGKPTLRCESDYAAQILVRSVFWEKSHS